ncbi:MAG: NAD(P)/FAD-dependent oxidoreductase [Bacteroidales bacterium]|nr:NAD(P)/FAD-dependent oxidoreductase [Bacteroidales bacterium]
MKYEYLIVGAGLGGLECGYWLAQKGHSVCVLEKNPQIGGCLQSFHRNGISFDTGFHYVGGMAEGEILYQLFDQLNLLHLPWHQLDADCFDEVVWNGKSYPFANGYDVFAEKLSSLFPNQRQDIHNYAGFLRKSQPKMADLMAPANPESSSFQMMATSAYQFMNQMITDDTLRNVLCGTSLKMELRADTLPLYIFAQINGTFLQSAWRLKGRGAQIAESLANDIRAFGGEVRTNCPVSGFEEKGGAIVAALVRDERVECEHLIANIHPNALFPLLPENLLRKTYRRRISELPNSTGMFTVNLKLKKNKVKYVNHNLFVHNQADLWGVNPDATGRIRSAGVHFAVPETEDSVAHGTLFAENIDIFCPMKWSEVARWADSHVGRRGEEYEVFKQKKAEEAIALVAPYIPGFQENIDAYFTSTPLTYRDYTGTFEGSAYGIRKDYDHLFLTMLPPKTPVPNLYFTGQNVNFHGVFGVTVSALQLVKGLIKE